MTPIEQNYARYLAAPLQMFRPPTKFPIIKVLEEFNVTETFWDIDFIITVQLCINDYGARMLVTNEVNVWMKGWVSDQYESQAAIMERAIVQVCRLKNFRIYNKLSSWPFAKADVGDNNLT